MIDGPTVLMRFLIYIPTIQSMTCIISIELVIMRAIHLTFEKTE